MSNYLSEFLFKILKKYDVSVTYGAIDHEVNTHPEYPSMQCISDIFDCFKVKNVVMKLSLEELCSLKVPIISHLKKGEFIWITQITDSKVYFWNSLCKKKSVCIDSFVQEWSGLALAIINISEAGISDYKEEYKKEIKEKICKYIISGLSIILLLVLTYIAWKNDSCFAILPKLFLFIFCSFGLFISYMLIHQDIHHHYGLLYKFCKVGKYIDCQKVTSSKYSNIGGIISLAELGAGYFSSMLLWISIGPLSDGWLFPFWWLSLIVLPFSFWSLVTQAFIIRKWCLLCCSIVILLMLNAFILIFFDHTFIVISITDTAMVTLLFIACLVAVMKASKAIDSKKIFNAHQREIAKLKYNTSTIRYYLSETTYLIDNLGFIFGNTESSYDIGLYVSIFCPQCRKAIKQFRKLIEIYPNLSYRLIFSINSNDYEDETNIIARQLFNTYNPMKKNDFFNILDTLYSMPLKTLKSLHDVFPVSSVIDRQVEINSLYTFSMNNSINYTPAIFLNKRLLSQLYTYKDLLGIIRAFNAEA